MPTYIGRELRASLNRWRFTRSELFSVGDSQEGSLPVILTILQLSRVLEHGHRDSKWITSLIVSGSPGIADCEIDFAYLMLGNRYGEQHLQMAIGECKGDTGEIEDVDIQHLKAVKESLDKKNIKGFLVFSKTGAGFSANELRRFRELSGNGIKPILFTGAELEPYDPYWDEHRTRAMPHPHPMNLEEMAENSAWLYLRDSSA